jgi:hypothetical protein
MTRRSILRDCGAATAAEFALVLPLLLLLLFGIIDAGRFLWDFNRAEKATQVGARVAVVTDSVPSGLASEDYVGQTVGGVTLTQGDAIPAAALGDIKCTRDSCSCETEPCPSTLGTINTDVFDNVLLRRMQSIFPYIEACNVELHYGGSGLGFAGDPNGMEIAPLVTVKLVHSATCALKFTPITSLLFLSFDMPEFSTTLPAEDESGSQSN